MQQIKIYTQGLSCQENWLAGFTDQVKPHSDSFDDIRRVAARLPEPGHTGV